ncbi:MAG: hypothetical protein Q8873_02470 [Bacillota bacterium]|nr:hypothetical protein [Bacillota bacterium]
MNDVIRKIITIEKNADELVEKAEKLNAGVEFEAEKEAAPAIEKINNDVEKKIAESKVQFSKMIEKKKKDARGNIETQKSKMTEKFEKEEDNWVQTVFKHIFG